MSFLELDWLTNLEEGRLRIKELYLKWNKEHYRYLYAGKLAINSQRTGYRTHLKLTTYLPQRCGWTLVVDELYPFVNKAPLIYHGWYQDVSEVCKDSVDGYHFHFSLHNLVNRVDVMFIINVWSAQKILKHVLFRWERKEGYLPEERSATYRERRKTVPLSYYWLIQTPTHLNSVSVNSPRLLCSYTIC